MVALLYEHQTLFLSIKLYETRLLPAFNTVNMAWVAGLGPAELFLVGLHVSEHRRGPRMELGLQRCEFLR